MSKQPKPKVHVTKAERVNTGIKHKKTHLNETEKILLNKGMMVTFTRTIFNSQNVGKTAKRKPLGRSKVA